MHIVIVPNDKGTPVGKLADAELHFGDGLLAGTKLVGFAIWESQWPGKNLTHPHLRVTVPSREYLAGTERRRYDLLRPVDGDGAFTDAVRDAILDAFAEYAARVDRAGQVAHETAQAAAARRPPTRAPQAQAPRGWRAIDTSTPDSPRQATPARRAAAPRREPNLDDVPF